MASHNEYKNIIYQLLPLGPAWPSYDDNSAVSAMIDIVSKEFSYLDSLIQAVYDEINPYLTSSMLDTYLDNWGLPNECMLKYPDKFTSDKYQQMLTAKIATWGLGFKDSLYKIAQIFGYQTHIERVTPFYTTSPVNKRLYNYKWSNVALFITTEGADRPQYFTTRWTVDNALCRYGDRAYECMLKTIVPSHLIPRFVYRDEEVKANV